MYVTIALFSNCSFASRTYLSQQFDGNSTFWDSPPTQLTCKGSELLKVKTVSTIEREHMMADFARRAARLVFSETGGTGCGVQRLLHVWAVGGRSWFKVLLSAWYGRCASNANRRMPCMYAHFYIISVLINDDIDLFFLLNSSFRILDEEDEDTSGILQVEVDPWFTCWANLINKVVKIAAEIWWDPVNQIWKSCCIYCSPPKWRGWTCIEPLEL